MELLLWGLISSLFLMYGINLVLSVVLLELLRFLLILILSSFSSLTLPTGYYLVLIFCCFVIDGVIALSGLVSLVRFSGSDYVGVFGLSQC